MKVTRYVFSIGFTVNGIQDETELDTTFHTYAYAIVDLINCFLEFVKENNFENVKVKYVEYIGRVIEE